MKLIFSNIHLTFEAGIPSAHRGELWQLLSGVKRKTMAFQGIYEALFQNYDINSYTSNLIHLDVDRTFPGYESCDFERKLGKVLVAYSLRNPQLGYCQAMNFLAGTLLLFMEEEEAFWMLVYIVEELLQNYFIQNMSGLLVDTQLFEQLVSKHLPSLWKHCQKINLAIPLICSPWFLCLFVNYLPNETTYSIWDSIMLEGVKTVFEVALGILRMFQEKLLLIPDAVDAMCFLTKQIGTIEEPSTLWAHVQPLDKEEVEMKRHQLRLKVEAETAKKKCVLRLMELERVTHFNVDELKSMWCEYIFIDQYLQYGTVGMDYDVFSRVMSATFSEWGGIHDQQLLRRLFRIIDTNTDEYVDFPELTKWLSILCRGSCEEKLKLSFHLFDVMDKGSISRDSYRRMLVSVYSMFYGNNFFKQITYFVEKNFEDVGGKGKDALSMDEFKETVALQPEIMKTFRALNPNKTFMVQRSFYYWLFDPDNSASNTDIVHLRVSVQSYAFELKKQEERKRDRRPFISINLS